MFEHHKGIKSHDDVLFKYGWSARLNAYTLASPISSPEPAVVTPAPTSLLCLCNLTTDCSLIDIFGAPKTLLSLSEFLVQMELKFPHLFVYLLVFSCQELLFLTY